MSVREWKSSVMRGTAVARMVLSWGRRDVGIGRRGGRGGTYEGDEEHGEVDAAHGEPDAAGRGVLRGWFDILGGLFGERWVVVEGVLENVWV